MHASTFSLHASQTGTEYKIQVATPEKQAAGAEGCPAVLFMDGDDQFRFAVAAYEAARAAKEVPALVLVGVGYGASYSKPANKRVRDYTPAQDAAMEPESGHADKFLAFLTDTLWPELVRRHGVREDLRGIGGHSLGSLLVLHALFQREPFFHRYLASAPSVWWADRALLGAVAQLQAEGPKLNARVFLSVGAKDSKSMTEDLTLLEQQLAEKPFPGLEVVSQRFAKRNHFNVLPDAFRAGLGALYGK